MLKIGLKHSGSFPSGKNHPNWKGGVTKINEKIRHCARFRKWREDVFHRDNYKCVECGEGCVLHPAHIKSLSSIIKDKNIKSLSDAYLEPELWDIKNGRTLCYKCHGNEHGINFNPNGNRNYRKLNCVVCKNSFKKSTRTSKKNPVKTCSRECRVKLMRSHLRRGSEVPCEYCGKMVFKHLRDIKKNENHFCGNNCYSLYRKH